ncbi:MAG: hypothetical protein QXD61_08875 [Candidatus Caldarchaeum sp.]
MRQRDPLLDIFEELDKMINEIDKELKELESPVEPINDGYLRDVETLSDILSRLRPECEKSGTDYEYHYKAYRIIIEAYLNAIDKWRSTLHTGIKTFRERLNGLHELRSKELRVAELLLQYLSQLISHSRAELSSYLNQRRNRLTEIIRRLDSQSSRMNEMVNNVGNVIERADTLTQRLRDLIPQTHEWEEDRRENHYPGQRPDELRPVTRVVGSRCRRCGSFIPADT